MLSGSEEEIPWHNFRHYNEPEKSVEQCASHGADHAASGWSRQIDARWNAEQRAAYLEAYQTGVLNRRGPKPWNDFHPVPSPHDGL